MNDFILFLLGTSIAINLILWLRINKLRQDVKFAKQNLGEKNE